MTREGIFGEIMGRGADKAVVSFSGGNDEGGPDDVFLMKNEQEVASMSPYYDEPEEDKEYVADFLNSLCEPIYDKWGSFAGDFTVYGNLIWDAKNRKVYFEGQESQYVDFNETL